MVSYFRTKDIRIRALCNVNELNLKIIKFFLNNISLEEKQRARVYMCGKTARRLSKYSTRTQNRCLLTTRSGGVFRHFRASRIKTKELASRGLLVGVQKSTW